MFDDSSYALPLQAIHVRRGDQARQKRVLREGFRDLQTARRMSEIAEGRYARVRDQRDTYPSIPGMPRDITRRSKKQAHTFCFCLSRQHSTQPCDLIDIERRCDSATAWRTIGGSQSEMRRAPDAILCYLISLLTLMLRKIRHSQGRPST